MITFCNLDQIAEFIYEWNEMNARYPGACEGKKKKKENIKHSNYTFCLVVVVPFTNENSLSRTLF